MLVSLLVIQVIDYMIRSEIFENDNIIDNNNNNNLILYIFHRNIFSKL